MVKEKKQNVEEEEEEDNGREECKIDRMSDSIRARSLDDFAEDILAHILTFLPTLDAVRTSILSREWQSRRLWRSLPFLDFFVSFNHMDARARFADFIDQTLKNRSGFPIQKFRIRFDVLFFYDLGIQSKLDDWISYSVSHNATELEIDLSGLYEYDFNFGLLKNSCVRDVRLYGVVNLCNGVPYSNLDSVKSVSLTEINLTDDTIMGLILWCNNLESLVIKYCYRMDNLRICSSTLKKLSLDHYVGSSLEICCPNLDFLSISDFKMKQYCIKDSASLVEADVHFIMDDGLRYINEYWSKLIRLLTGVKRLTAQNYWFELLCETDASLDCFVFENLNHLELKTGCGHYDLLGMAALFKLCPTITTLTLRISSVLTEYNVIVPEELLDKPIEFNIPNLKILNLKNSEGVKIEELLRLMKKHGDALEKIVLWDQNGKRSSISLGGSS